VTRERWIFLARETRASRKEALSGSSREDEQSARSLEIVSGQPASERHAGKSDNARDRDLTRARSLAAFPAPARRSGLTRGFFLSRFLSSADRWTSPCSILGLAQLRRFGRLETRQYLASGARYAQRSIAYLFSADQRIESPDKAECQQQSR